MAGRRRNGHHRPAPLHRPGREATASGRANGSQATGRVVEGALRRVEGEDQPHRHEDHQEVDEEGGQLASSALGPQAPAEGQHEEAAHQHRHAAHAARPTSPAWSRPRSRSRWRNTLAGDRVAADRELLVVGRDPQGVAARRGKGSAEHRQVPRQPWRQHQQEGGGRRRARQDRTRARPHPPGYGGGDHEQQPVHAGQRGHAGQGAGRHQPPTRAWRPDGPDGAPHGARARRPEEGDVVDLRIEDQERPGQRWPGCRPPTPPGASATAPSRRRR